MPMVEAHRPPALGDVLPPGATTGIGSLPHRSVHEAAAFVLREYDLPAIPTLPRRSPAEGMIAQAVVGIRGITLGQYGSVAVDRDAVDPSSPVATDLANDAYAALRTFLSTAARAAWPRPGEVAVRRLRSRSAWRSRGRASRRRGVRRRSGRRALPWADDHGRRRRRPPRLAAGRLARRAVVRRADAPRLPDRPRSGHRPPVERDGGRAADGHRRGALLCGCGHRLVAGHGSGHGWRSP